MCINHTEADIVYNCLASNEVVSPISFYKGLAKPPLDEVEAYQVLEDILLQEGSNNPYADLLFHDPSSQNTDPFNEYMEVFQQGNKTTNTKGMEDWSILGTQITYPHTTYHNSLIFLQEGPSAILQEWTLSPSCPQVQQINLPDQPNLEDYLDSHEEVENFLNLSGQYDDHRDVSTTYLGTEKIYSTDRYTLEPSVPIYSNSHTWGQILGGGMLDILIDTGASKCYMSKAYYKRNTYLHTLPKFKSKVPKLQVDNGEVVDTHHVIPLVLKIQQHKFEIFTLVAEIQDSIDLVIGMKNLHELEAEHSSRHSELRFMNRAIPMFTMENFSIKPGQKRLVKFIAPFFRHLTGVAIVKVMTGTQVHTLQCKLHNNLGILDIVNTSKIPMFFNEQTAFGIVDIRSLGFYHIRHSTLQYNLSLHSHAYNHMQPLPGRQHVKLHTTPKQTCRPRSKHKSADSDK